jgi:poly-gamma-glutamate synthesis protein (capsule biosynthesis protein)
VYAGTGRNLGEARAAQFVELPKGRVGLVGMLSQGINGGSEAATYAFSGDPGRPGVNILHLTTFHVLPQEQIDELRKMRDEAYTHRTEFSNPVEPLSAKESKTTLNFWGTMYKAGTAPGGLSYTMNAEDEREILRSIRNGKELSDYMIAIIHSHEDNSLLQTLFLSENTPEFLVKFAHETIDNGADVFIGTGPHVLRGVEIYHGKPIFYGLSSLVNYWSTGNPPLSAYLGHHLNPFDTEYTGTDLDYDGAAFRLAIPIDFDSVFGECKYQDGKLTEVILHPIDQGYDLPQADRGTPRAAHGAAAQRILQHLQDLSKPFGTTIAIVGETGVIRVDPGQAGKPTKY